MPSVPRVFVTYEEGDEIRSQIGGQDVNRYHTYHAYHDGAVFLVRFYKTARPEKLLKGLLEEERFRGKSVRDFRANGLAAKEYESKSENMYAKAHFVVSGNYLYWIEAAARAPGHPAVEAFLSSFKVGQPNLADTSAPSPIIGASVPSTPAEPDDKAFTAKEVTRKAVLIYRAEPQYTLEARTQGTTGSVIIRVVFGADGAVTRIAPVERLPNGLTEKAVEAARNLRFLPAEKDGRKVSQYATFMYNFNLH